MKTMVIAVVSALAASAATATAARTGLIGSAQIRAGSIQLADISPQAKRALRGQRGPRGPEGIAGPAGAFDPQRLVRVESAEVTIAAGFHGLPVATCPNGSYVLGGGFGMRGSQTLAPLPDIVVQSSVPLGASTWRASIHNRSVETAYGWVRAVCAEVAAPGRKSG